MTVRAGWLGSAGRAFALQWRAAPVASAALYALTAVAGLMPVAAASLTRDLLDELARPPGPRGHAAIGLVIALTLAGALATSSLYLAGYLGSVVRQRITLLVEQRLFRRVAHLRSMRPFEDPRFHDRLLLAERGACEAPQALSSFAQDSVRSILVIVGFAGAVSVVWAPMGTLLVATGAMGLVAQMATARRQSSVARAVAHTYRERETYRSLLRDPRAAKELRLFALQGMFHGRMVDALRRAVRQELAVDGRGAFIQAGIALLGGAVSAIGAAVVVAAAIDGRFTIGDVTLFLAAVAAIQGALAGIVLQVGEAARHLALFRDYLEMVNAPDEMADGTLETAPLRHAIELRDVWFRYGPGDPWILRGVNLRIPARAGVALVGLNGAGKSTLAKLLFRFYDPTRGRILWDGVDLRDLRIDSLRTRLSASFQDFMNYELTGAENIGVGAIERIRDRRRIERAAVDADVHATLTGLRNGYETVLSRVLTGSDPDDPGVTLSGGQWQRVALARSHMRDDVDLVVLDEPTAALDPEAEHRTFETMRRATRGHAWLLIAHRLAAVRDADLIAVLADGRVIESGRHDDLLASGGTYARLFRLQADRYAPSESIAALPA
jgi:ATP-binding cassette subfamily B protein